MDRMNLDRATSPGVVYRLHYYLLRRPYAVPASELPDISGDIHSRLQRSFGDMAAFDVSLNRAIAEGPGSRGGYYVDVWLSCNASGVMPLSSYVDAVTTAIRDALAARYVPNTNERWSEVYSVVPPSYATVDPTHRLEPPEEPSVPGIDPTADVVRGKLYHVHILGNLPPEYLERHPGKRYPELERILTDALSGLGLLRFVVRGREFPGAYVVARASAPGDAYSGLDIEVFFAPPGGKVGEWIARVTEKVREAISGLSAIDGVPVDRILPLRAVAAAGPFDVSQLEHYLPPHGGFFERIIDIAEWIPVGLAVYFGWRIFGLRGAIAAGVPAFAYFKGPDFFGRRPTELIIGAPLAVGLYTLATTKPLFASGARMHPVGHPHSL